MKTTAGKIAAAYKASQVNLAGLVKDVGNKILLLTVPNIGAGVTTSVLTLASELQQSTGEPIILCCTNHISFVFAIFIVGNHDNFSIAKCLNGFFNCVKLEHYILLKSCFGKKIHCYPVLRFTLLFSVLH